MKCLMHFFACLLTLHVMVSSEASSRSKEVSREAIVYLVCFKTAPRKTGIFMWFSGPLGQIKLFRSSIWTFRCTEKQKNPKLFKFNQLYPKTSLARSKSCGEKLLCLKKDNGNFLKNAFSHVLIDVLL